MEDFFRGEGVPPSQSLGGCEFSESAPTRSCANWDCIYSTTGATAGIFLKCCEVSIQRDGPDGGSSCPSGPPRCGSFLRALPSPQKPPQPSSHSPFPIPHSPTHKSAASILRSAPCGTPTELRSPSSVSITGTLPLSLTKYQVPLARRLAGITTVRVEVPDAVNNAS